MGLELREWRAEFPRWVEEGEISESRVACEASLHEYLRQAWPNFESVKFVDGVHIAAICEHLEAVSLGQIKRLIINIPPRHAKPVWEEEFVLEQKRGRIPLREVKVGDYVLTHHGRFRRVLAVHLQGLLKLVEVKTWSGRSVKAAPDHPFLTANGWRNAGDLAPGDILGVAVPGYCGTDLLTDGECRLLGYLVGDGCLTQNQPRIVASDEAVSLDIEGIAADMGFRTNRKPNNGGWKSWNVTLLGGVGRGKGTMNPLRTWLTKHGLWGSSAYTKRVPAEILAASPSQVANFLGAYWSTDGYIAKRGYGRNDCCVGCDSVSRDLLVDVQHLLLRLGVSSRLRTKTAKIRSKRQGGDTYTSYCLTISDMDNAAKFIQRVPIVHPKRERGDNFRRTGFDPRLIPDEVVAVLDGGEGECRCLTVDEDGSFTANDLAVSNTSIVSIAWPTWTWVRRNDPKNNLVGPRVKFLCASYAAGKAQQDAVTARRLIGTKWYQDRWGKRVKITRDRDNQEQYDVEAGGYRISTGIPESLGKGGLIRIIDDPHKTGDVESEAVIEKQVRDYNEVWRTRTNDPLGGAEVIIMQRLGEADLTGYLLESEDDQDIVHLCLPALYDPVYHCSTPIGWSDPRTVKDESLWPERHPVEWYQTQKRRIGSFAFAGQYQQLPAPRGGGIIQREWWQLWPPVGEEKTWGGHWPSFYYVCAYLDTAFTSKDTNAWCALTVFGVFTYRARTRVAMIAGWRERPTLVGLVTKTRETCEKWKVDNLIIENKAGAEWVRQEIQKQMDKRSIKFTITLDEPTGDKVARARAVSAQFEEKMIYAPDKEWADMVIKEVENFPKGRWKDLTDTVTGAIGFLRRSNILEMDVDAEEREATQDVWGGRRETVAERYGL